MDFLIKQAVPQDAPVIAGLAVQMWDSNTLEGLTEEFKEYLGQGEGVVFLVFEGKNAVGFAQCGLRHDYVEGTETSPVGYLEGIFVTEPCRNQGVARQLLDACQKWAVEQGCMEFASDCELTNEDSLRFHLGVGFSEVNRVICFVKKLGETS